MTLNSKYLEQVRILIDILPLISHDHRFAIKGGTAINLFFFDMPRLSVDIDLCYLPLKPREQALNDISQFIRELSLKIKAMGLKTEEKKIVGAYESTLFIQSKNVRIKVEINLVVRGSVYQPVSRSLVTQAKDLFKRDAEILCLDTKDLFAGKICAALDRQHPRDFFDLYQYLKQFPYTRELHQVVIVYLLSSKRPLSELIKPNVLNMQSAYEKQFDGMTAFNISCETLELTRSQVFDMIPAFFTEQEKEFLISFKSGDPQWDLMPIANIQDFPSVQWKLYNIRSMAPDKRRNDLMKLKKKLNYSSIALA